MSPSKEVAIVSIINSKINRSGIVKYCLFWDFDQTPPVGAMRTVILQMICSENFSLKKNFVM